MNWLRWWHGTVSDPKFRRIAKVANTTLPNVLAVWASMLEHASGNSPRGSIQGLDIYDVAENLGIAADVAELVLKTFHDRGMVLEDGTLAGWSKRQAKRERPDDDSTSRVQKHRAKKREGVTDDVTPRNATKRPEKNREEEKREDTPLPPAERGEGRGGWVFASHEEYVALAKKAEERLANCPANKIQEVLEGYPIEWGRHALNAAAGKKCFSVVDFVRGVLERCAEQGGPPTVGLPRLANLEDSRAKALGRRLA